MKTFDEWWEKSGLAIVVNQPGLSMLTGSARENVEHITESIKESCVQAWMAGVEAERQKHGQSSHCCGLAKEQIGELAKSIVSIVRLTDAHKELSSTMVSARIINQERKIFGSVAAAEVRETVKELYRERIIPINPERHGKISPNDLEVMIHYYLWSSLLEPHPRYDAPAVSEAVQRFEEKGLLVNIATQQYQITTKGKAWMQVILSTPFPKRVWLDANGKLIDIDDD